jgi:hypothetical protein
VAGGPINGVSWAAAGSVIGLGGLSALERGKIDTNDPNSHLGIIVPTVMRIATDALNYWTSLTCLYDRYWSADPDVVTLPICMFHVKKITPTFSNEVSKKRVILYEPAEDRRTPVEKAADPLRAGVMQTVVDNIVKNPRTYSMEIIVPFQPIGRYVGEGVKTISDMIVAFSDLFGGNEAPGGVSDWLGGIFSTVFSMLGAANTMAEFAGKLPGMDGVSYINMNSLEAMADSCRTLCMKMWTGYDYKFVTITNMTYDKDPKEDDVFRATLTLQEMPVLSITRPNTPLEPAPIKRNWAVTAITAVQGALISPLVAMTGVKKAAGSDEKWTKMLKDTL